eukprot:scaffold1687_cov405-Prasinococcus_capsulatus_cf.AAC.8
MARTGHRPQGVHSQWASVRERHESAAYGPQRLLRSCVCVSQLESALGEVPAWSDTARGTECHNMSTGRPQPRPWWSRTQR